MAGKPKLELSEKIRKIKKILENEEKAWTRARHGTTHTKKRNKLKEKEQKKQRK